MTRGNYADVFFSESGTTDRVFESKIRRVIKD